MSYGTEITKPKARKNHRCYWCGETICRGETYVRWGWAEDGKMSTVRMHPECYKAASDSIKSNYDEYLPECENPRGCSCQFDKHCDCGWQDMEPKPGPEDQPTEQARRADR